MSRLDPTRPDAMRPDAESLRGKVVLVTGSGHGLGASLARTVAGSRARVERNGCTARASMNVAPGDVSPRRAAAAR